VIKVLHCDVTSASSFDGRWLTIAKPTPNFRPSPAIFFNTRWLDIREFYQLFWRRAREAYIVDIPKAMEDAVQAVRRIDSDLNSASARAHSGSTSNRPGLDG
jgi:hypothetical protein